MKRIYSLVAATAIMATSSFAADAKAKDGMRYHVQDNLRYEGVDQNNANTKATAITNRFVLGATYKAGSFSTMIEAINISALDDSYNDLNPANGTEPEAVVLDPEQTRITQAKLMYKSKALDATFGRDMYTLDGHRFVGHVYWRQMPQTFDVAALEYKGIEDLNVKAAYVFGRHTPAFYDNLLGTQRDGVIQANTRTNSVLLNVNYKVNKTLALRAYNYMISSDSDTLGGAVIGSAGNFGYKVELAQQSSASLETSNTTKATIASANYSNIELSYKAMGVKFIVAQETLGSDGTRGFSTPWATLHKFNGWSDQFLATPTNGLVDTSIGAVYKAKEGAGKFIAMYHTFDADSGSNDYGTELNLQYTNDITAVKGLSYLLKYADFSADANGGKVDITKVWASLGYKFASK